MNSFGRKKYPTIGCCGINCGLCPRYYTDGKSRCPGCFGADFSRKHPSCSFITCCVKRRHQETCASCEEFPCSKFERWQAGDSFVTHRNCMENLAAIREKGIGRFIRQQKSRMEMLSYLLKNCNDGKSKSFYCLAAGILPAAELTKAINECKAAHNADHDKIEIAETIKSILSNGAKKSHIRLEYKRS